MSISETQEKQTLSDYLELRKSVDHLDEIRVAIGHFSEHTKELSNADISENRREYLNEQIQLLTYRYLDVENIAETHNVDSYIADKESFDGVVKAALKDVNDELQASHQQLADYPAEIKQRATDIDVVRKHKDEISEKLIAFSEYRELLLKTEKSYDTLKKMNSSKNYDDYNLRMAQQEGYEHTNIHVQRVIDTKSSDVSHFNAIKKEAQSLNSVMKSLNKQEKALLNLDTSKPHLDLLNKSSEVRSQAASSEANTQFKRLKAGVMMMASACAVAGKTVYDTMKKAAEITVKTSAAAVVVATVLVGKSYYFGETGDIINQLNTDIATMDNYNPNTDSVNLYSVMSDTFFGTSIVSDKIDEIKERSLLSSVITVEELTPLVETLEYNSMNIDESILNNVNSLQSDDEIKLQDNTFKMSNDEKTFSI